MSWLTDRRLLAAALAAWGLVALVCLVFGPSLGHDEAAFAIVARGDEPPGAWLYRSEGTVTIARIGFALGGAAWQLRLISALLNGLVLVGAYAVGRTVFAPRTGAWAAAILAGAHPMALRSAELLSDLPAAAAILGGVALLASELDRDDGPRWRLVLAGPIFAAAFYLRYGSSPVIAFAIAVACLLWWRAALRRPLPVLAMVGVLALLIVPHVLHSRSVTGTLLGILEISAGMPRRAYIGEGLVTYLTTNPFMFYGFLVAPVMVVGIVGMLRARRKAPWFLAIVALGQIVSLGLDSHGQPRYVFVAAALLVVLGVAVLQQPGFARPRAALALVAAAWLAVAIVAPIYCRHLDDSRAPIVEAAGVLRTASAGRPCLAVALIVPQLMWYSPCRVFASGLLEDPLPTDRVRYAAWFSRWPLDLPKLLAAQHLRATPIATGDPRTQVWQLDAAP
jgi:4-amino-4-deoxy-L-arabinose transferase-like glycosyltransferase